MGMYAYEFACVQWSLLIHGHSICGFKYLQMLNLWLEDLRETPGHFLGGKCLPLSPRRGSDVWGGQGSRKSSGCFLLQKVSFVK